ncbi:MAG: PAS domain-containing sensor histidine kinase [Gammaproteobacteria bacterium]
MPPGANPTPPPLTGTPEPSTRSPAATREWQALRYFNLYRTILAGLLVVLEPAGLAPPRLADGDPRLFALTAALYLGFSIISQFAIHWRRPAFQRQVWLQVSADIGALSLMMHASGGLNSGFGILLLVAVAGGSLLTAGRIAILFAALASLAVLASQVVTPVHPRAVQPHYAEAGILGAAFFATAFFLYLLARRIRATEALAVRRGIDLADLAELNEHIIQRMQSGIVVVDSEAKVRLMNDSARALLGFDRRQEVIGRSLDALSRDLAARLQAWRQDLSRPPQLLRPGRAAMEILASFAQLGQTNAAGTLVFLEDASAMRQRAQRLKLASLGRLTASIAHEIRNPLGAISHAGQLLAEGPELRPASQRLVGIIEDNCRRVNGIIENVLQVSRRRPSVPEMLALEVWLRGFVQEFVAQRAGAAQRVGLRITAEPLRVRFDPSQLHQVLWNLCENGIRHGGPQPHLTLQAGIAREAERPYVEVVDNGPGIADRDAESVFEPFYTTASGGTGLGLYLARELCEANQAALDLLPREQSGCCFRITFSNPRRREAPL